ncbi:MAG: hypothetical protein WCR51_14160 [Planctomycetia bacterium]
MMATATLRSSRLPPSSDDQASSPTLKWLAGIALLALLAFLIAWLGGWIRFTTDPRVAEIRKLQEEARQKFAASGGPQTLAEATEAVTMMATIRQKVEALPPNLRPQAERSGGSVFRSAMRQRIDAYFTLPPEKRQAELDRQIKQEEMMRKAFETAGKVAGFFGGGPPGGGQGSAQGGQAGSQGGGGPPGGGPPQGASQDASNKWRKGMIDSTTPEQRARYVEYRRAMDQRRKELGMPSWGPR